MASDSHDRWLFLLALATVPLACSDDISIDPSPEGSTASPATTTAASGDADHGWTSAVTVTGLDDAASAEGPVADEESSSGRVGTSDGATSLEPGTSTSTSTGSSEGGSTSGGTSELCGQWGENAAVCYGHDDPAYFTSYCYEYLLGLAPVCAALGHQYYACRATGCFVDCTAEDEALQECSDEAEAIALGCDMIPMVPGTGTIEMQCSEIVAQATVCTNAGYDIPGLSQYIINQPQYADYFCNHGSYFTYFFPPPAAGNPCGGAYEELLSCLSDLDCSELEQAMGSTGHCLAEIDAVTCRCELDA